VPIITALWTSSFHGEFELLDRLLRRIGRDHRHRAQPVADIGEHLGIEHVERAAARAPRRLIGEINMAQAARRVAMREVDADLVHARAEITRQLRQGAVGRMGARG
jgi:hypothetical protein